MLVPEKPLSGQMALSFITQNLRIRVQTAKMIRILPRIPELTIYQQFRNTSMYGLKLTVLILTNLLLCFINVLFFLLFKYNFMLITLASLVVIQYKNDFVVFSHCSVTQISFEICSSLFFYYNSMSLSYLTE